VGAVALVVIHRVLQLDHRPRKAKVDVMGSVLVVLGVSLLLVAVQNASAAARITTVSWIYGTAGLCLILAFVWWEGRAPEPIIPLHLFKNRVFTVANALSFITGGVMFGAIIFLPQYFQRVRGISPTLAGLRLLPLLAGMLVLSITCGRLISRYGRYKIYVIVGTFVLAASLGWITTIGIATSGWILALMMFLVGAGVGMFMQTLIISVQNAIPWEYMGTGTAAVTFFRTLGGAIGAAVLGAILVEQEKTTTARYIHEYGPKVGPLQAFTHGMDTALLYAVPVAVVGFVLSFMLREVRLRSATGPDEGQDGAPRGDATAGAAVAASG
jgi:MFS family permease